MKLIVKICGLSSEEMVAAAIEAGADMIGLVFFPPSPRYVTLDRASRLAALARGRAEVAALTVDMSDRGLADIVEAVKPDWLQLHGKETPARVAAIKKRFARRAMKAIGLREPADLALAGAYRGIADRLLLDAKPPAGAALPGGNGMAFDWTILEGFDAGMPWLLSGGLGPTNVGTAIRVSGAHGVDVSSGVESAPGKKEASLIHAFVAAARRTAARQPERAF